jgi:hypothetical protein
MRIDESIKPKVSQKIEAQGDLTKKAVQLAVRVWAS